MAEAGSQLQSRGEWTLRVWRRVDGGPRGARSPVVALGGAGPVQPGTERRERARGGPPRVRELIRTDRPRAGSREAFCSRRREERASSLAGVLDRALLEVQLEEVAPEGSVEAEEPERLFLGGAVAGLVGGRLLPALAGCSARPARCSRWLVQCSTRRSLAVRALRGAGPSAWARWQRLHSAKLRCCLPLSETAAESLPCKPEMTVSVTYRSC